MKAADYEEEIGFCGWKMQWNRLTLTYSITLEKDFFDRKDHDILVIREDGAHITKLEMDIKHFQDQIAEIMRIGDLK